MRYRHFLQKKYSYGQEAPFLREAGKKDASEALTEAAFRETLLHGPLSSEGLRQMNFHLNYLVNYLHGPLSSEGLRLTTLFKQSEIDLARTSELGGVTTY